MSMVALSQAHAAFIVSPKKDIPEVVTKPVDRYTLETDWDDSAVPLLADGKNSVDIRIKVIDNEARVIKKLEFDIKGKESEAVGTISVNKLNTEYLVTYTTPDITKTDITKATNWIVMYYTDADNIRRYKQLTIPLENTTFFRVEKSGFVEQKVPIAFSGPFAYVSVVTLAPDGEKIPMNTVRLTSESISEALNTDASGMIKIENPKPFDDNHINNVTVFLELDDKLTALQRETWQSYEALTKSGSAKNNTVENFLNTFPLVLAQAESDEAAQKMISGLYRLNTIFYLLNRGDNTAGFAGRNIAKAARNELWETLDLSDSLITLTNGIAAKIEATSKSSTASEELQALLQSYPIDFVELASSVSGITISLHTPNLDEGIVNGLFMRIIQLVADKGVSGAEWGDSWFEKMIISYFQEQTHQMSKNIMLILAEMITNNTFSESFTEEALLAQQESFRTKTDRIMAEEKTATPPLLNSDELQIAFNNHNTTGQMYLALVQTTENAFSKVIKRYVTDDDFAKWLHLYQLTLEETKTAVNETAGFAKADASRLPLMIPMVFADGSVYEHRHDPVMEKVVPYQLAVTQALFYEQLLQIGKHLVALNLDTNLIIPVINELEEKLKTTQAEVDTLVTGVPREFRAVDGKLQNTSTPIPLVRLVSFALLVLIGIGYLVYTLSRSEKRTKSESALLAASQDNSLD